MIYCALTLKPVEKVDLKLQGIIPSRLNNSGKTPTIRTVEKDEQIERWSYKVEPKDLDQDQKQRIMAGVLGIQIGLTYDTHFYEFNGQIYKQGGGAPTGVRPVGPMSRIIMDKWVRQMREIEEKSNLLHSINQIQFEK